MSVQFDLDLLSPDPTVAALARKLLQGAERTGCMEDVVCSWSGGKESTLALESVLRETSFEIAALMTTAVEGASRMSIHGVRLELLERQASALGFPLDIVRIPENATGGEYVQTMTDVFSGYVETGVDRLILGDVFAEDDPDFRGTAMESTGLSSYCPLLDAETRNLVRQFVSGGYEAVTVAVNESLGREFVGQTVNEEFLEGLPESVDPAGETGEYHTFVCDGPVFDHRVAFERGDIVERETVTGAMVYADLVPTETA